MIFKIATEKTKIQDLSIKGSVFKKWLNRGKYTANNKKTRLDKAAKIK